MWAVSRRFWNAASGFVRGFLGIPSVVPADATLARERIEKAQRQPRCC